MSISILILIVKEAFEISSPTAESTISKNYITCYIMKQISSENKPNTEICFNVYNKPQCLCFYPVDVVEGEKHSFRCLHCKAVYHTTCMKKKSSDEYCCYCHLEKMIPIKKVVQTVYVGHLKKSAFKHQARFFMPNIAQNQYYQFRCLRLK